MRGIGIRGAGMIPVSMQGGGQGQRYGDIIMGISGLVSYLPCDDISGATVRDASGNNRTGTLWTPAEVTLAQAGLKGLCFRLTGTFGAKIISGAALTAAVDQHEYSVSMLVNFVNPPGGVQAVRLVNTWVDGTSEYSALEAGAASTLMRVALKEGGVTQSIYSGTVGSVAVGSWQHIVFFNSESTGNAGVYYNKEYRPGCRNLTLVGSTPPIDANMPEFGMYLDGYIQHVAVWNRMLTQGEVDSLYNGAFAPAAPWSLAWSFRDEFTTDEAAPMASPRACEPGPGALTLTDTGNKFSVAGGKLVWTTKTVNNTDPRAVSAAITKVAGLAAVGQSTPGTVVIGFGHNTTFHPLDASFCFEGANISIFANGGAAQMALGAKVNGTTYQTANVYLPVGSLFFIKGGVYANWTLFHVAPASSGATCYAAIGASATNAASNVELLRTCTLGAPFTSRISMTASRLAGNRTAGDVFTHNGDCILRYQVWTRNSAGVSEMRFRMQDATNYWSVKVAADGTPTLYEVVAGGETSRGAGAAGSVAAANSWVEVILIGQTIYVVIDDTRRITYTAAANFETETDGKLQDEGTNGIISDIEVYPRTLAAADGAILDSLFV